MTELLVGARRGLHAVGRSHWPTIVLFVLLLAACIALLRRDSQSFAALELAQRADAGFKRQWRNWRTSSKIDER